SGDRLFGKRKNAVVIGKDDFVTEARADRIAPGEESGARWRTDIPGSVVVSCHQAFPGHAVDSGSWDRSAIRLDVAIAKVVAQDDNEIWFGSACLHGSAMWNRNRAGPRWTQNNCDG